MKKRAICTIHSLKHKVNVKLYHNIISLDNKKWRQNLGLQHLLIEFRYDSQPALGISQSNSLHFLFFSQFSAGSSWLVSRLGIKQHTCPFLYFNFAFSPTTCTRPWISGSIFCFKLHALPVSFPCTNHLPIKPYLTVF